VGRTCLWNSFEYAMAATVEVEAQHPSCEVTNGASALRCVVVDCGGVTNDDSGMNKSLRSYVAEEWAEQIPEVWKQVWRATRDNPDASEEAFWAQICEPLHLDRAAGREVDREIRERFRQPFQETLALLRHAKASGLVLGMISNHIRFWFDECANSSGLDDLMHPDLIVVSNEVACSKPSPRIFEVFLERLQRLHPDLLAKDCAFVDDKEENVAAAVTLGFQGVHYDARKAAPGDLQKALQAVGLVLTS